MSMSGWIGVDLDGTLAHYQGWNGGSIGKPIPAMLSRVKEWLAEGVEVRIFTARVDGIFPADAEPGLLEGRIAETTLAGLQEVVVPIREWCQEHVGQVLTITNRKDFAMIELWDDRAVQVEANTGRRVDGKP